MDARLLAPQLRIIHSHLENSEQAKVLKQQVEIITLTTRQLNRELTASPISTPDYAAAAAGAVEAVCTALQAGASEACLECCTVLGGLGTWQTGALNLRQRPLED